MRFLVLNKVGGTSLSEMMVPRYQYTRRHAPETRIYVSTAVRSSYLASKNHVTKSDILHL
jgi:hypothetical protein